MSVDVLGYKNPGRTILDHLHGETVLDRALSDENKLEQKPIYYLTSLKYGGEEIEAKLPGVDPATGDAIPAVAIITEPKYYGDGTNMSVVIYVDTAAQSKIRGVNKKGGSIDLEIDFVGFEYSTDTHKFFKSVWLDQARKAKVVGSPPHPRKHGKVGSIELYEMRFDLLFENDSEEQTMNVAYEETAKDAILVSKPRNS